MVSQSPIRLNSHREECITVKMQGPHDGQSFPTRLGGVRCRRVNVLQVEPAIERNVEAIFTYFLFDAVQHQVDSLQDLCGREKIAKVVFVAYDEPKTN